MAPGAVNTPMLWNNPNVKSGKEKVERRRRRAGGPGGGSLLPRLRRGPFRQRHDAGRRWGTVGYSVRTLCNAHDQFMFATGIENSYPTIEWQGQDDSPR